MPLLALGHAQDVVDGVGGVPEQRRVSRHCWTWAGTLSARSVASDLLHLLSCFVPNYPEMSTTWAQIICYLAPLTFLFTFYFSPFCLDGGHVQRTFILQLWGLCAGFVKGFTFMAGGEDHKMEVIMTVVGWDTGGVSSKKNKSKRSHCLKFKYFGTGIGRE